MTKPIPLISTVHVLRLRNYHQEGLEKLLEHYQMELILSPDNQAIPGSFWGDDEAGLIGNKLYARQDTPIHSILHELSHFICMDQTRRAKLHTNAGGGYDEEDAVCFLQLILSDQLPEMGQKIMMNDMDTWGYSFRLGSTQAWFQADAEDAKHWLIEQQLIDSNLNPSFHLRD